ncbi:thiamine diphosphokinase [Citreimonas salinaria]|uniref:Thiamine diphosphokinase n=1 Tax=Citreimonas salinaria TaxID=321339 RepID=A0A1H3FYB9_9RHOB|nr:thiamine diphosphokinase [Citreimonas salinaria]SDX95991.1 thiamine diphosphokinase [Citreimonas salinaria]
MKAPIVSSAAPVLLVGGGPTDPDALRAALDDCPVRVAADSGALALLAMDVIPDAVIGDMDSLPDLGLARMPARLVHRIAEQDSTDFDKALRNIDAPLVFAHGFLGARLDHQLAVLSVLARRPERRCILVGRPDVAVLAPPALALDLQAGTRVSLFPMARVTGQSEGLRWPIDGLVLAPDGVIGTSNEVSGPVRLEFDAPGMVLILPATELPALQAALGDQTLGWPARV